MSAAFLKFALLNYDFAHYLSTLKPHCMDKYRYMFKDFEEGLFAELKSKGRIVEAKAGQSLLESGQYIRNTMIVLEGLVKLFRESDEGSEFFMYHLHPGESCALSLICDRNVRASSVTAKAVTVLLVVPLEHTENWMRQYRTWSFCSGHLQASLRGIAGNHRSYRFPEYG